MFFFFFTRFEIARPEQATHILRGEEESCSNKEWPTSQWSFTEPLSSLTAPHSLQTATPSAKILDLQRARITVYWPSFVFVRQYYFMNKHNLRGAPPPLHRFSFYLNPFVNCCTCKLVPSRKTQQKNTTEWSYEGMHLCFTVRITNLCFTVRITRIYLA